MADKNPETVVGTYSVRAGAETEFEQALAQNWPILHGLGFVTDDPPLILRSIAEPREYLEILTWQPGGMDPAHEHPDVIPIWETIKRTVEPRAKVVDPDSRGFDFPAYEVLSLVG